MAEEIVREPRILLIKADEPKGLAEIWEEQFPCKKIDYAENSDIALERRINPQEYDVLIIDASDNLPVNGIFSEDYTEYARKINPDLFVIGVSNCGAYFKNDDLSRRVYDELFCSFFIARKRETNMIRNLMENKGFKFRSKE